MDRDNIGGIGATTCRAPSAVIFDFNGTIANDGQLMKEIYSELLGEYGIHLDENAYHALSGQPDVDLLVALTQSEQGNTGAMREHLTYRRVDKYMKMVSQDLLDTQTLEFVQIVADRVPVAIASGAFHREIIHALDVFGLRDIFTIIVAIDDVAFGKPRPDTFLEALTRINAMHRLRLTPPDVLVIEDATAGVQAARAAGMPCLVLRGPAYDESSDLASMVVDRLTPNLALQLFS